MSIRLEEIKEAIRREIRKELKIKEGAEKLREVAKDRRSLSDVAVLVKKSKSKLAELKSELQELESQILLTSANSAVNSNGQGESKNNCATYITIEMSFVQMFVALKDNTLHSSPNNIPFCCQFLTSICHANFQLSGYASSHLSI